MCRSRLTESAIAIDGCWPKLVYIAQYQLQPQQLASPFEERALLSSQSRPVIEATLPVVGEHIQTIAKRFYERLFTSHPSLLDGTFNRGNQHDGSQQQALAGPWRPSPPGW